MTQTPQDRHVGQTYDLTRPRLLAFPEAIAAIAEAAGRDVRFVPVTPEDFAAGLTTSDWTPTAQPTLGSPR